jgi:hypothetical protein
MIAAASAIPSSSKGACPLRCCASARFRLKWAADQFKLLRSPLMGAAGFCLCVVVLWEGGCYNGGVGEVGALWHPRSSLLAFLSAVSGLKIVVSEVEILPPFLHGSPPFICFRRSAVLFE